MWVPELDRFIKPGSMTSWQVLSHRSQPIMCQCDQTKICIVFYMHFTWILLIGHLQEKQPTKIRLTHFPPAKMSSVWANLHKITLHFAHQSPLEDSNSPAYGLTNHSTLQIFTYFENPKEYIIKFAYMSLHGWDLGCLGTWE